MLNRRLLFAFVAAIVLSTPALSAQQPDNRTPKNLQVLPTNWPRDSVIRVMRIFTASLGVRCQYCHVGREGMPLDSFDFASDEKPQKETAREMMRLTRAVNADIERIRVKPAGMNTTALRVTCATCHRGAPRPVTLEDTLRRIVETKGIDSAVVAYRALRQRHYGRYAFDFSERPLGELAAMYATSGKSAEARRLLELNAELFPDQPNVIMELGRFYEQSGEKALAIAQYRKVLTSQPQNRQVQQRLRALGDTTGLPPATPRP